MARFTRQEIESALEHMDELRLQSSEQADWSIWAQCLSEDVEFYDEIYGAYSGKQAVTDFVVRVHAPFPNLRYKRDWTMIDTDRAEVIFHQYMCLPEPEGYVGDPFALKIWSRHRYAGDNQWSLKHDVPLPSSNSGQVFGAWMAAGGQLVAEPLAHPEQG